MRNYTPTYTNSTYAVVARNLSTAEVRGITVYQKYYYYFEFLPVSLSL